jgi:hypothetical protein
MSHLGAQIPDEASASLLDNVRIASPCSAKWDEMIGDDRVRYCGQCTKNVYNLSAMPREEAEALLRAGSPRPGARRSVDERDAQGGEGVCVRLYRRADGTVLTADCPDGARRKKRRLAIFGAVGAGLMAAGAVGVEAYGASTEQGAQVAPPVHLMGAAPMPLMGEPAVTGSVAPPEPPPPPPAKVTPPPHLQGHWMGGAPVAYPMGRVQHRDAPR